MKALVTGGTRGIGAAIAKDLMQKGYQVTLTGTQYAGRTPRKAVYYSCDFSNLQDVQHLADHIRTGGYSILINNAGINKIEMLERYPLRDFQRIQQVNVTAPFLFCQAAIPFMRRKKFGRIVNISSIFSVVSREKRSAYSASKFSLVGLSRALALEVARDNILVNCVAPGYVDTDLTRNILGKNGMKQLARQIPMQRLAKPKEIAAWVRFLASQENTYMTGQNVVIDGGFTCA